MKKNVVEILSEEISGLYKRLRLTKPLNMISPITSWNDLLVIVNLSKGTKYE